MLKRRKAPFAGQWNFIGGKIEHGEKPVSSAKRELAEEAGLWVAEGRLRFQGLAVWPSSHHPLTLMGMMLFAVQIRAAKTINSQLALIDEGVLAWLPESFLMREASAHVVPNVKLLMEMFKLRTRIRSMLLHSPNESGQWDIAMSPLPPHHQEIDKTGEGPWAGKLSDLVRGYTATRRVEVFMRQIASTNLD